MNDKGSVYLAWCGAIIGSTLCFVYPAFTRVPVLWYYPLDHRWQLTAQPSGFAMDWYGRSLLALVGGAIAFLIVRVASRRLQPSTRTIRLWTSWFVTATILAIAVYSYQLALRRPIPEPLPSWYVPR